MNTHDIELPPLPSPFGIVDPDGTEGMMQYTIRDLQDYAKAYARAAIEADRKQRHLKERAQLDQEWSVLKGMQAQYEAVRKRRGQPVAWQPIETAPKGNKRRLYLARLDARGNLVELDFDGVWEYWQESWELSHINGYCWMSNNGIEEPTHWAYQDEPLPTTQPADRQRRGESAPPKDEACFEDWVTASDVDGVRYDGPSFERGYQCGKIAELDRLTGQAPEWPDFARMEASLHRLKERLVFENSRRNDLEQKILGKRNG